MSKKKHISAVVMGTALEYYDYVLYMHFLIILSPLFFPNTTPEMNVLLGFSGLAIGYLAKPVGSVVFGHMGDRLGRRKAMGAAILFSTLGTFCIGLLPAYSQIGILAPILLILCRFSQGFSVGGETSGAACFLLENSSENNQCLRSSYLNVASMGAGMIATLLGFLCTQTFMPDWFWRIPFLMVIFFGAIGFYIRNKLEETPEFQKIRKENKIVKIPLLEVLKHDKLSILCSIGLCAGYAAPFTVLYAYLPHVMKNKFNFLAPEILLISFGVMVAAAVTSPLIGILGDRLGKAKTTVYFGLGFFVTVYPLFIAINSTQTPIGVFIPEVLITLFASCMAIPFYATVCHMYPTQRRHSGVAFSTGLGLIIFGGLSPIICEKLVRFTGNENSPALWLMFCAFAMILSLKFAPNVYASGYASGKQKRDDIDEDDKDTLEGVLANAL